MGISTALTVGGTLLHGVGAKKQAAYNARVLRMQGKVAEEQALVSEAGQRRENQQFLGKQAAAFAESGVGYGGSALDVMSQSAKEAELDALTIRYKGQLAKFGYQTDAELAKREGNSAFLSSALLAGGELLKGRANYRGT